MAGFALHEYSFSVYSNISNIFLRITTKASKLASERAVQFICANEPDLVEKKKRECEWRRTTRLPIWRGVGSVI